MARRPKITFSGFEPVAGPILVALVAEDLAAPAGAATAFAGLQGVLDTLAKREKFTGKAGTTLELVLPGPDQPEKLIIVGIGKAEEAGNRTAAEWKSLGGKIAGLAPKSRALVIAADGADGEKAADLALGFQLALYKFDRYKTKKNGDEGDETTGPVTIQLADAAAAKRAIKRRDALHAGVILARDLVNEPPNVLHPEEFADRVQRLDKLDVTVLDEKALKKIGMRALLGVGQGSAFESRVVIMVWNGAKDPNEKPLAFVGKGVTFDTGGISIKPAQGMEDMKGDMAGAAAVVGLMHALAERAAKVNAIGIIGLVENMPDGSAQRPGDIVTSLSGQTIEIINTDAEGRLVLGDLLWYVQNKYQPQFMINLATLTGAIMVALGQEHAGLFSNDDALAEKIAAAGKSSGEKVWRMPLGKDYDKQIDSKFADMKNTGGRNAGSITAAQFLQRFVNETPWAHLDIAGTAMASPATDINKSWASGWGVQLLDALVAENYEK